MIILDEPTNFLDAVHVDWLVKFLKDFKGAFLIVSHHQGFLNEVVNVIMEIENGQIIRYRGNYQSYLSQKALRIDEYAQKYQTQQKEIKKLEEYVSKNKARASTASLAKSRQKKLDKMNAWHRLVSNKLRFIWIFVINQSPRINYWWLKIWKSAIIIRCFRRCLLCLKAEKN